MKFTTAPEIHMWDLDIAPALREFMCNTEPFTDLDDCINFVCSVYDLDATDELIDRVSDEFDSFFGN